MRFFGYAQKAAAAILAKFYKEMLPLDLKFS